MVSGLVQRFKGFLPGLLIIIGLLPANVSGQQHFNYSELFGPDWQKAIAYLNENNSWIRESLEKYDIPYNDAVAVIFPELVRYSAISDKMEITLLKALYRNIGRGYADFSVGEFQIKPSFAERTRSAIPSVPGKKSAELFKRRSSFRNDYEYRVAIIADLENPRAELNYIIAFYLICKKRFGIEKLDNVSRIKFLATAYNSGFWKKKEDIILMEEKKFFNTKMFRTENYSYADVALYWYNNYSSAR
jgi:hypothetical protein